MSRKFLSLNTFRDTGQPSKVNLNIFKRYFKASVDTFFPRLCLCCNKKISDGYLCLNCQEKITFLQPPLCKYCSALVVVENGNICKKCFKNPPFKEEKCKQTCCYRGNNKSKKNGPVPQAQNTMVY